MELFLNPINIWKYENIYQSIYQSKYENISFIISFKKYITNTCILLNQTYWCAIYYKRLKMSAKEKKKTNLGESCVQTDPRLLLHENIQTKCIVKTFGFSFSKYKHSFKHFSLVQSKSTKRGEYEDCDSIPGNSVFRNSKTEGFHSVSL